MPSTPKRLYGPALIATGPVTIYTVPAVTKTIVKQIHISNPSASPVTFSLSLGADAAGTRLWQTYPIPVASDPNSVRDFFMYMVMNAAEIIQIAAGTNNILNIAIFGDEETL